MDIVFVGLIAFVAGFGISWGLACVFGMEPMPRPCKMTEEQWRKYGWKRDYKQ